jgi:uncharacterized protein (TIGR00290 family)
MSTPRAICCWSSGKDAAYCLYQILSEGSFDVAYLLSTVNAVAGRVSMHGVRQELLDRQSAAVGIPLLKVEVSTGSNQEYEEVMKTAWLQVKEEGIRHVIFGDIFLDDLRAYRERQLAAIGMKAVFPLWKKDTAVLIRDLIGLGFRAKVCCTHDKYLGGDWAGRAIDRSFVDDLPAVVDPCGENGEYHSFCYDGPLFSRPVSVSTGEKVYRPLEIKTAGTAGNPVTEGFWFCDLLPAEKRDGG